MLYGINQMILGLISERDMHQPYPKTITLIGLGDSRIIAPLNMHAGVIASKNKRGSETFHAKFREFVQCLED